MISGNPSGMTIYSPPVANDLLLAYQHLAAGLQSDPHLCLAATIAWLDPAWTLAEDEFNLYEDETSTLSHALHILRQPFPELYLEMVVTLRGGGTYADVERLVCHRMQELGYPLEELAWLPYGIPMPAYGASLLEPDFYEVHPEVVPVVELFGVSVGDEIDIADTTYRTGYFIADHLLHHAEDGYQPLAWLLSWLFSCSGNTLVDADDEELCEIQPLAWEPDNMALAREIITEADDIMTQVTAGLEGLYTQPEVFAALKKNANRVTRWFEKQKGDNHATPRIRLHWPALAGRPDGAAEPVA